MKNKDIGKIFQQLSASLLLPLGSLYRQIIDSYAWSAVCIFRFQLKLSPA